LTIPPQELDDLGASVEHAEIIDELYENLFTWTRRMSQRTTISEDQIRAMRKGGSACKGILFGLYDENDAAPELLKKYQGKASSIPPRE